MRRVCCRGARGERVGLEAAVLATNGIVEMLNHLPHVRLAGSDEPVLRSVGVNLPDVTVEGVVGERRRQLLKDGQKRASIAGQRD